MNNGFMVPAAAIVVALFFALIGAILTRRGFRKTFFLFFPIFFLVGWSGQLWISPFGPAYWGVSWFTLLFLGLIFLFLIIALSPPMNPPPKDQINAIEGTSVVLGVFFWFLIVMLLTSILIGYSRTPLA